MGSRNNGIFQPVLETKEGGPEATPIQLIAVENWFEELIAAGAARAVNWRESEEVLHDQVRPVVVSLHLHYPSGVVEQEGGRSVLRGPGRKVGLGVPEDLQDRFPVR